MVRINIDEILQSLPVFEPEHKVRTGCSSCGSGEEDSRCGNGLEKIYPTTAVRYGYMKHIGEFTYPSNMKFTCGSRVVIQTSRGLEIGEQVSLVCNGCSKSVTRDQVREYVRNSGEESFLFDAGRILREANRADLAEYARLQSVIPAHRELCRDLAKKHGLPIKVIECELLFGGERAIFYFSAEGRIDFRDLVRDLLAELQTRIQMVQIGARDEARLLADYETCGRECCCKVFLKTLKPVSMKMAKLQKQTVDPSKVSGRCGRLKCCLRYEHESYEDLAKKLPRIGARIRTAHGDGVVVNRQILTQLVQVQTFEDKLITVTIEDVLPGEPQRAASVEGPRAGAEGARGDAIRPPRRGFEGRRPRQEGAPPQEGSSDGAGAPTADALSRTSGERAVPPPHEQSASQEPPRPVPSPQRRGPASQNAGSASRGRMRRRTVRREISPRKADDSGETAGGTSSETGTPGGTPPGEGSATGRGRRFRRVRRGVDRRSQDGGSTEGKGGSGPSSPDRSDAEPGGSGDKPQERPPG